MLINALNFIKQVLEANFKLYTLIKNERVDNQKLQIHPQTKPSPSHTKTRQGSLCYSFFSRKNLTLEKLKLIIFSQMYK